MLFNFVRFLFLRAALNNFEGWMVVWRAGAPCASRLGTQLPEGAYSSLVFENGVWELAGDGEYIGRISYSCTSLLQVFSLAIGCRYASLLGKVNKLQDKLVAVRGAISIRVLLFLFGDMHPWTKLAWSSETNYRNGAGWTIKHYSSGAIQAKNVDTHAEIGFTAHGCFGSWHVTSAVDPERDATSCRAPQMHARTRSMIKALMCL